MSFQRAEMSLRDYGVALRRRRKLLTRVPLLILIPAVALAWLLPAVYRSQAIILIEQQEIPSDLVRSTVTSFADQRIQVISQRVMTSANLIEIMEKYDLYPEERERQPREVVLGQMRQDIGRNMISAEVVDPRSGRPTEATIAFSLSFESESPVLAQRVANELVSLYLNENIKSRTAAAAETASFLTDEAAALRDRVQELEAKLAAFKAENADNQPELERVTREMMNRADFELVEVERRLQVAEQNRIFLEGELAQTEPYRDVSPGIVSSLERLRAVEAELASAEASYGARHPDVVRLRKMADALRSQVRPAEARGIYEEELEAAELALAAASRSYGPEHPDVVAAERKVAAVRAKLEALPEDDSDEVPTNPAYVSVAARLQSAISEIESLRQKRAVLREKLDQHIANLNRIPQVEAEYRALNREYQSALAKYQEITAKQMEARLSENLETERKGEKFTLIEPPLQPEEPASPNRTAILIVGLLLAVVGGLGSVALAEALDNRVRGRRGVQEILTAPPLASIPLIMDGRAATVPSYRRYILAAGGMGFLLACLAVLHFAYKPLDVLWFVVLRKLGL